MEHNRQDYDTHYDQFARPHVAKETKRVYMWDTQSYRTLTVLRPEPRVQDMPHIKDCAPRETRSTMEEAVEKIEDWLRVKGKGTVNDIKIGCKLGDNIVRHALIGDDRFVLMGTTGIGNKAQVWGLSE